MNLIHINYYVELVLNLIVLILVSYFIIKGYFKLQASSFWILLLLGVWISEAMGFMFWISIVICLNGQCNPKFLAIMSPICNSISLVCVCVTHWVFSFRYWIFARKIQQIGLFHITPQEISDYKLISWIGILLNSLFAIQN